MYFILDSYKRNSNNFLKKKNKKSIFFDDIEELYNILAKGRFFMMDKPKLEYYVIYDNNLN